jgi:hypothetical protein
MRKAILTKAATAILIGAAIAPAAPAGAQGGNGAPDRGDSQARAADHDRLVLRRDGDRAVQADPVVPPSREPVLRRDPSKAVPFESGRPTPSEDGFHWGDALIGAAGGYALIVLASGALVLIRRRRPPRRLSERPA